MQAAWPATHRRQPHGPSLLGHLGGAARAGRILQAFETLSSVAFEPASHRGLALTDNGRDLGHLEPLFCREEDHLRPGPQPRIFGGAIQVIEFRAVHGGQRW